MVLVPLDGFKSTSAPRTIIRRRRPSRNSLGDPGMLRGEALSGIKNDRSVYLQPNIRRRQVARSNRHAAVQKVDQGKTAAGYGLTLADHPSFPLSILGLIMNDVAEFLAYAIKLEEDAAARFSDLAESMKTYGNREVAEFFGKMAHFSRLHLAEARKRAGFHKLPDMKPEDYKWPGDESPEATSMEGSHYLMTAEYALALALSSEESGYDFYHNVATTTKDSEIRMMAEEFAEEEAEHVAELKKWVKRYEAA
jgi:rubrerythrin